ncbi:MAG: hypothetical protein ACI9SY_000344 [Candidatus Paceibacteria bacterium]|jgi:hypothetical protein
MNEILHANVFFVIASVATVIFCIVTSLILFHVLKLVKSVRRIVERIEEASEQVADDVAQARSFLYNGGMIARVMGFMAGARRSTRRSRDDD